MQISIPPKRRSSSETVFPKCDTRISSRTDLAVPDTLPGKDMPDLRILRFLQTVSYTQVHRHFTLFQTIGTKHTGS